MFIKRRINLTMIYTKLRIVIFVFVILVISSSRKTPASNIPPTSKKRNINSQVDSRQANNPLTSVNDKYQVSLEMKENVDFLLTPVFLLQEAVSENIVITYPSE